MIHWLVSRMRYEGLEEIDLDSIERIELHRRLVEEKPALKRVYRELYETFVPHLEGLPEGPLVELGSGWSFLPDVIPGVWRTDISPIPGMALRCDALRLPFGDRTVSALFLTNALHHLPDAERFLQEARRVLKPGGRIMMVEPHVTALTLFIWKHFHHEGFDYDSGWSFDSTGPLSSADLCIPWKVFTRDYRRFKDLFPEMEVVARQTHSGMAYVLTGGFSLRSLVPSWTYSGIRITDRIVSRLTGGVTDQFETLIVEKGR